MDSERALLLPGERIDELRWLSLRIIQSPAAFRFGMDAVLLADFARPRPRARVCDLGTGTGILPLLLIGQAEGLTIDAVELQPDAADRARRTMALNNLSRRITVHEGDLRQVSALLPRKAFDLVVCNPPYSQRDASLPSPQAALRISRQEGECTLGDVCAAAAYLLRGKGRFSLMLPAPRLPEAFDTLREHRLEPKRLRLVHANAARHARLALIEAMAEARPGLMVEPPLIHKNPDGGDTQEVLRIYGGRCPESQR